MNKKQIEAYSYYKAKQPRTIFLFSNNDHYEAFSEDAKVISDTFGLALNDDVVMVPAAGILDKVSILFQAGYETKLISYRDDDGKCGIPDISRIADDQANDY